MSINLKKTTDRLKKTINDVFASVDKVFLDINSTFVEINKTFHDINQTIDRDIVAETTVNGKKTTVRIDSFGNITVNGKRVFTEETTERKTNKSDDAKRADSKSNRLATEIDSIWKEIKIVFK